MRSFPEHAISAQGWLVALACNQSIIVDELE
jgi:hypothetical protein